MVSVSATQNYHTVIIGAGLAGLILAYKLKQAGLDVLLVDSNNRVGGAFNSKFYDDSLYEFGPNTIMNNVPEMMDLISDLGLEDEIISTAFKDSKRYFSFNEGLIEVPVNPLKFLASPLLSIGAKLRLFAEPFIKDKAQGNESIFDFISRRCGKDFARTIVSNFFQGIWGGDVHQLEASSTIGKLYECEQKHGSILAGMLKKPKSKKRKEALQIISFKQGLSTLTNRLAEEIGPENIKLNCDPNGAWHHLGHNLVLACPAPQAAEILAPRYEALAQELSKIEYAPIALVATKISKSHLSFDAEGFGFLVANANLPQTRMSLGTIWSSEVFAERKLSDHLLMVNILGGATHPEIKDLSLEQIQKISSEEIALAMRLEAQNLEVIDSQLIPQAIPQYNLGHKARIERIEALIAEIPGLNLAGNYLHGVSVADTLKLSLKLSEQIKNTKIDMVKS